MSGTAARGAAGYLYASGRLGASSKQKAQRAANLAAEELRRQRMAAQETVKRKKFSTTGIGEKRNERN